MGVLRLYRLGEDGAQGPSVVGELLQLGARADGEWRARYAIHAPREGQELPLTVVVLANRSFVMRGRDLLDSEEDTTASTGETMQQLLQEQTTDRGVALKPRQAAAIEGSRYRLGDFVVCVGRATVRGRGRGSVAAVEYLPSNCWSCREDSDSQVDCATHAANFGDATGLLNELEGALSGGESTMRRAAVVPDLTEFSACGLSLRDWSARHAALLYAMLFRRMT